MRHDCSCKGLALRASECVSPAETVPTLRLVTARLAQVTQEHPVTAEITAGKCSPRTL